MTRPAAVAIIRKLARDLSADDAPRLLERISAHDEAVTLRAALAELGAEAVLAGPTPGRLTEVRCVIVDPGKSVVVLPDNGRGGRGGGRIQ